METEAEKYEVWLSTDLLSGAGGDDITSSPNLFDDGILTQPFNINHITSASPEIDAGSTTHFDFDSANSETMPMDVLMNDLMDEDILTQPVNSSILRHG